MTSEKDISVAIVGSGFIGPTHLEALRRLPGVRAIGLVEFSHDLAIEKAKKLGIPKAYRNFEEMLADPLVDVVVLATPNYLHYPQAKAALEAGKNVICEKPLALNTRQSKELVELATRNKLVNAVNFNLRFYPLMHHAHHMVQNGELGDIFIMQGSYLQDWLLFTNDWNWRLDPEISGSSRAVSDIGSHWLDLLTFISKKRVVEVFAEFTTFHPTRKRPTKRTDTFANQISTQLEYEDIPITTEDYATILMHFEGGAQGVLTVAQVCAGRKNRLFFEINGSRASISFDSEHPNELWVGRRDSPNQVIMKDPNLLSNEACAITSYPGGHTEGFPDTFKQLGEKVYQYIRRGDFESKPDFPTFADGHYELILNEAIELSARQRCWVQIQE